MSLPLTQARDKTGRKMGLYCTVGCTTAQHCTTNTQNFHTPFPWQENVTTDALNSWILDVRVGASSAGDHVAFGFDDKLAILQSKYSNQQQQQQHVGFESEENCASFVTLFKDVITAAPVARDGAPPPPRERISCVICLPIASQKK